MSMWRWYCEVRAVSKVNDSVEWVVESAVRQRA